MLLVILIGLGIAICFGGIVFLGAPYVPSHRKEIVSAFSELRPLQSKDVVLDAGSGDGIVVQVARQCGAGRALGYELNPLLVLISKVRLRHDRAAAIRLVNFWITRPDSTVTVVYVFGVGRDMARFERYFSDWVQSTGKPLDVIVYGHIFPHRRAIKDLRAHHLYHFPLQGS